MLEMTSPERWLENDTSGGKEYGRTGFTKYVVVNWKRVRDKAERSVIVMSLQTVCGQATDEVVESGMEDAEAQWFC